MTDKPEATDPPARTEPVPVIPLESFGGKYDLWVAANLVHFYNHLVDGVCSDPLESFPIGLGVQLIEIGDKAREYGLKLGKYFGDTASRENIQALGRFAISEGSSAAIEFSLAAGMSHDFDEDDGHAHDPDDDHFDDHLRADDDGMPPPLRRTIN